MRRRSKQLNFRLTADEYERIAKKAEKANITVSAFLISSALNKSIVFVHGLPETYLELHRIGNNINQLTKLCHEGHIKCLELSSVKKSLEGILQELLNLSRTKS